jgi:hypothetical protein
MDTITVARKERAMTTTAASGWYVVYPEGGAWVAVEINSGQMVQMIEEADAPTHVAARDGLAWVAESVLSGDTDTDVTPDHAAAVVAAYDTGIAADCCVVERISE